MEDLLGLTIYEIYVNFDQSEIFFKTGSSYISYTTYGDCCSETWFADILGDFTFPMYITGIEILDLPEPSDERSRQEYDLVYGYRLKHETGTLDIIYRNSSNGYYGGSIGEAKIIEDRPEGLTRITSDWQA